MHQSGRLLFGLLATISVLLGVCPAEETRVSSRDELVHALREAKPGTTILIAPGTYRGGLSQAKLVGTKEQPIVIAAADPGSPPVIEGGGSGLHMSSPEYVELRHIVFDGASGNGLNVDDSGSVDTPARHLALHNVTVRNVGPSGNRDGIKLSGVREFQIVNCRVERWGDGGSAIDMVGCAKGMIKECKFLNARGDAANGVQAKGGTTEIVIEHCRFENAGGRAVNAGGSTGLDYFRPRDAQYEAKDITVKDCKFVGGLSAVAFVGVDGALVEHNTIYRPRRWVFRVLQESTNSRFVPSRKGQVINNVIAFRSDEVREVINIGGNTSPETFKFSGNAWCCLDRPEDTQRFVRLPVMETQGTYGNVPAFKDAASGDIHILNRGSTDAGVRQRSESD